MRILVVDDDSICRLLVRAILDRVGDVDCCENGSTAIDAFHSALAQGAAYDLVCLDVMMPEITGLEVLEAIRSEEESHGRLRPNATKIIMITALGSRDNIEAAFCNLCDAYLVKPVRPPELLNIVGYLCNSEEVETRTPVQQRDY